MSNQRIIHKRLLSLTLKKRRYWVIIALLSVLTAIITIVLMYVLSSIIHAVFIQSWSLEALRKPLLWLALAMLIKGFIPWFTELCRQEAATSVKEFLRKELVRHIHRGGAVWTAGESSGELATTAVEGVDRLNDYYSRFLPAAVHMFIVPVILVLFILRVDWPSGLILIITGPLIPVFMTLIGLKAQDQTQKQWSSLRRLGHHFLDAVQGLRTIKLFNYTATKQKEIEQISDKFRTSTMGVLKTAFLSGFVLEFFASIATALVAVGIGIRLIEGQMEFQAGLFVLLLTPEFYLSFRTFGAQHHAGMEGVEAATRLFEILDTPVINRDSSCVDGAYPGINPPYVIHLKNVSFTYPGNRSQTICSCSFTLVPGIITALAGMSGSGKTTLLRLLTKQYTPDSGEILVNNTPFHRVEESFWLQNVAVVQQDIRFFDDSVLENLKIARPDATSEEIIHATKAAEVHGTILKLPQGYHTKVGEQAIRFSGGERQRLAIARAFLRKASVILFDEPSSALDPENETLVNKALQRLLKHKTVLVIAHRLSTVQNADHILIINNGRIVSSGNHQQLYKECDIYRSMINANPPEPINEPGNR